MSLHKALVRNLFNLRGWRTSRHLLVIESDDWGSVRMPSREVYSKLLDAGVRLSKYGYEKVDTIASREDLAALFEVCDKHRDVKGRSACITANCVVANPDFAKIEQNGYEQYFYEPITVTMERYYPGQSPFPVWQEGMRAKVFCPQFHGREHVNVPLWIKTLQADVGGARLACRNGVFSIVVATEFDRRGKNMAAWNYADDKEKEVIKQSLVEGMEFFRSIFGYNSESCIAPSYWWDDDLEATLAGLGVKYLQGRHTHVVRGEKTYTYIGRRNSHGQIYLNRNADFEYSQEPNIDWNGDCLKDIAAAFRWHKPATISAHRLNFIGALDRKNRDDNLWLFDRLLSDIQKQWPDVEFLSTAELGKQMEMSQEQS